MTLRLPLIAITFLLGVTPAYASFSDVPSTHPNADAIVYVQTQGIVSGYPDGTYGPDAKINRAEFTKIVIGLPLTDDALRLCDYSTLAFNDTDKNAWYAPYLCFAAEQKIIGGYPDGSFRPADQINFVEASKILANVFFSRSESTDGSVWYKLPVTGLGNLNAIPVSITRFDQNITRGEMAEMIYRLKTEKTNKPSQTYDSLQSNTNEAQAQTGLRSFSDNDLSVAFSYPAAWILQINRDAGYGNKWWISQVLPCDECDVDHQKTEMVLSELTEESLQQELKMSSDYHAKITKRSDGSTMYVYDVGAIYGADRQILLLKGDRAIFIGVPDIDSALKDGRWTIKKDLAESVTFD